MSVDGHLYQTGSSRRVAARLRRTETGYRITTAGDGIGRDLSIARITERLASIPQKITFETGEAFVPDAPFPDGFLGAHEAKRSRRVAAFERFSPLKAGLLVALLVAGVLALREAIPVVADGIAGLVPRSVESKIGARTFTELGGVFFKPSALSRSRRDDLRDQFARLAAAGGYTDLPAIRFRTSTLLGANAFALPGGPIVVTDALVHLMPEDAHITAILAHELGHVEQRHGLRQVLRVAGLFLMASMILGADDTMLEELAAVAASLSTSRYSRDFESEADAFAKRLLAKAGRSGADLAAALEVLTRDCGADCDEAGWFSTHPGITDRAAALRN